MCIRDRSLPQTHGRLVPPRRGAIGVAEDRPFARVGKPCQTPSAAAGIQHALRDGFGAIEVLVLDGGNNEHRAKQPIGLQ
eukprot:9876778-Alexandrium_andersonii.AAC.1